MLIPLIPLAGADEDRLIEHELDKQLAWLPLIGAMSVRGAIEERASVDAAFRDAVAAWADEARRALCMASPTAGPPESGTGSFHFTIGDVTHHHYYS